MNSIVISVLFISGLNYDWVKIVLLWFIWTNILDLKTWFSGISDVKVKFYRHEKCAEFIAISDIALMNFSIILQMCNAWTLGNKILHFNKEVNLLCTVQTSNQSFLFQDKQKKFDYLYGLLQTFKQLVSVSIDTGCRLRSAY